MKKLLALGLAKRWRRHSAATFEQTREA